MSSFNNVNYPPILQIVIRGNNFGSGLPPSSVIITTRTGSSVACVSASTGGNVYVDANSIQCLISTTGGLPFGPVSIAVTVATKTVAVSAFGLRPHVVCPVGMFADGPGDYCTTCPATVSYCLGNNLSSIATPDYWKTVSGHGRWTLGRGGHSCRAS